MRIGYILSCEEFGPADLIDQARKAEKAGFEGLWISDHFHPWVEAQGQSPFVWSMIGALSQVCRLPVMTAVTCPTVRLHPAIVAQAAATSAVLHEGRFVLGLGSGEALNEHIYGDPWPSTDVRLEMLAEAIDVMRKLWTGKVVDHRGSYYTVDKARLYTLPEQPLKAYISGFGAKSTDLAARLGDGYVSTEPDPSMVRRFRTSGGGDKPTTAGFKVCFAPSEDEGVRIAHERWASELLPGEAAQVLPLPKHFEQLSPLVPAEKTRQTRVCGPDPDRHLAAIDKFVQAGFDEIYVNNIGPHWDGFFDLYAKHVLPKLRG
jgi:G6PDH family F420-dependent oxidoreductase